MKEKKQDLLNSRKYTSFKEILKATEKFRMFIRIVMSASHFDFIIIIDQTGY